ncbi:ATP-binding protein [Pseudoalteromonas sp. OOF1S-7]|uniref:ATP-binding protein n=1 Tax=Pseudoalteromonas sp. OOF1S-7 TaxID=2917757 RepID=UPI001EF56D87|nr:ATP-binding protein [Pseudoalteromonas sp. OOF1S-7]MCG7537905.1 ATP-binding protein [Pseudoalteromonas sp. OOF1S-7]
MNIKLVAKKYADLKWLGAAQMIEKLQLQEPISTTAVCNVLNDIAVSQENYFAVSRQARLKKAAKLRWPDALVEDFDYRCETQEVQYLIDKACETDWVKGHSHQVMTGSSGTGKTTLACGIANKLLMHGYSVRMWRFNDLVFDLALHEKEGTHPQFLRKLSKFNVLVIDDWALFPLTNKQRQMLYELIERREQVGSLMITSQYDFDKWHEAIGEQTIADAVLDRIASMAERIALRGDPKRKSHRAKGGNS